MKTISNILSLLFATMVFAACSHSNTPEYVAERFIKALYTGNSDEAASFCTVETREAVNFILGFVSSSIGDLKKTTPEIKVLSTEMSDDGQASKVRLGVSGYYDIRERKVSDELHEETVNLILVDDRWQVVMRK